MSINYNDIVRSISYDQNEILYNILKLYNNGNDFDCDPTYSKGGFYNKSKEFPVNSPKYKFDVFPIINGVEKIEPLGKFPLDDDSIQSINIDLPFVCAPPNAPSMKREGKEHNIIQRRFVSYYPIQEMFKSYYHFLEESFRVLKPGGICIFKTQRNISGSITYMTPQYSWMCAEKIGFYTIDEFILLARNRLWSGKIKEQQHSRAFHSSFFVFQKPISKRFRTVDYFKWKENV